MFMHRKWNGHATLNSAVRSGAKRFNGDLNDLIKFKGRWNSADKQEKHNDTVGRLFNLQIAIIYNEFTVLTLTAPWYCDRNLGQW